MNIDENLAVTIGGGFFVGAFFPQKKEVTER
jgi:hypothetical protein